MTARDPIAVFAPPRARASRARTLRRWHRACGLVAGVGLIWLALTGTPLLLTDTLGLAHRPVPSWVAAHVYGIAQADARTTLSAQGHRLAAVDGEWRFDGRPVLATPRAPIALVSTEGLWFAVGPRNVVLLDASGEVVERFEVESIGLPSIASAWHDPGAGACVGSPSGDVRCTRDGGRWTPGAPRSVHAPVGTVAVPSLERALQDLHALRFAGPLAPWLGATFGLALMFLGVSGLWAAWRRRH